MKIGWPNLRFDRPCWWTFVGDIVLRLCVYRYYYELLCFNWMTFRLNYGWPDTLSVIIFSRIVFVCKKKKNKNKRQLYKFSKKHDTYHNNNFMLYFARYLILQRYSNCIFSCLFYVNTMHHYCSFLLNNIFLFLFLDM